MLYTHCFVCPIIKNLVNGAVFVPTILKLKHFLKYSITIRNHPCIKDCSSASLKFAPQAPPDFEK